ncbi:hypothetical protein NA57DRAFT_59323 [Rhizodiscina lignyota]|uniref:C2H2-type domain-containing protein n=1 Tax=Rhizodiscina lignyota TaxID=1504668 RepID=A0A9P4M323_9PEZI|nr:hypothetical protein NA57DRAFT_59323 [Rhizodiscina lignyota]
MSSYPERSSVLSQFTGNVGTSSAAVIATFLEQDDVDWLLFPEDDTDSVNLAQENTFDDFLDPAFVLDTYLCSKSPTVSSPDVFADLLTDFGTEGDFDGSSSACKPKYLNLLDLFIFFSISVILTEITGFKFSKVSINFLYELIFALCKALSSDILYCFPFSWNVTHLIFNLRYKSLFSCSEPNVCTRRHRCGPPWREQISNNQETPFLATCLERKKDFHAPIRRFVCTWSRDCNKTFTRRSDLHRHCNALHRRLEEYWCPVKGCERSQYYCGDGSLIGLQSRPFPRKDKRDDHVRKAHNTIEWNSVF